MDVDVRTEVDAIQHLLDAAPLSADARNTVGWCIRQLPKLYRDFARTHETRYDEEVRRLILGVFQKLAEQPGSSEVAAAILVQLQALHARLGLQPVEPAPVPKTKGRTKKAARP